MKKRENKKSKKRVQKMRILKIQKAKFSQILESQFRRNKKKTMTLLMKSRKKKK